MAYATGTDLVERFDWEVVSQLASDERVELTKGEVVSLPALVTALDDASGRIESALIHGGRYTPAELSGLTGNSLSHLKRITCTLAMVGLLRRRPGVYADLLQLLTTDAEEYLKMISTGVDVFNLTPEINAGVIDDGGNRQFQEIQTSKTRQSISDNMTGHLYGFRDDSYNGRYR